MRLRYIWSWFRAEFGWRVLGKRYAVHLTEEAQRQLDELPEDAQAGVRKAMERISRNPYSSDSADVITLKRLKIGGAF